ncbi:MAG: hypothetical protein IJ745_00310 [Bacteroidales bacterium]|nr:hypothetical protein [Bacteroidales bacterium]
MKKFFIVVLLLVCISATAQRKKVSVSKDGAMVVNGDTVAYIEKEGCKILSPSCQFFITDETDAVMITASVRSFTDKERATPEFPGGVNVDYLVFSFQGVDATAEVEGPGMIVKAESVAKIVVQWRLIKDGKLDPEAVAHFVTHHGNRYSEKERRQNQPPSIQIIQEMD